MRVLLDTNVCSHFLSQKDPRFEEHFQRLAREEILLCSVVKAELQFGIAKGNPSELRRSRAAILMEQFESLPFDDLAAQCYGTIRAYLEARGQSIGPNDLMIASIAVAHELVLATFNSSEFDRVPDLRIWNWESPAQLGPAEGS